MTTPVKSITESDLIKEIIKNVNALSNHLVKSRKIGKKSSLGLDGYFEFYIFSSVCLAMKNKGYFCLVYNRDSLNNFIVARSGHEIYKNDFSYIKFAKPRCDEWTCKEIHISLYLLGSSGAKQEADVVVFPIGNGNYYRKNSKTFESATKNSTQKRVNKRINTFIECKLHKSLDLVHPRSLIGSFIDLRPARAILTSNALSLGGQKIIDYTDTVLNIEQFNLNRILHKMGINPKTDNADVVKFFEDEMQS